MNILKERVSNLIFGILCLVACFPLFSMKMTVIFIIVFTCSSFLAGFIWNRGSIAKKRTAELALLLFPFSLIALRTFFTDRSPEAIFYLEVSMSLLAFPVAFFMTPTPITTRKKGILNILFVLSTFSIVIFGMAKVILKILANIGPDKFWKSSSQMFNDPSFAFLVRTTFENEVSIHPTYASIFLGISVLILLDKVLRKFKILSQAEKLLYYFSIFLALVLLGILASRTPFLATMISGLALFFMHLKKKINALYAITGIVTITVLLILVVPSMSSRFKEISFSNTELPTAKHENSFNLRTGIYKCSMEIISDNWLWGIGPGNVQTVLNECYGKLSKESYENKNYNTHNQFLDYWAGLGILGPISLLMILAFASYKNFQINRYLVSTLVILFLFALLTENLLTRQNGIVPFAYFIGLYFFTTPAETKYI